MKRKHTCRQFPVTSSFGTDASWMSFEIGANEDLPVFPPIELLTCVAGCVWVANGRHWVGLFARGRISEPHCRLTPVKTC